MRTGTVSWYCPFQEHPELVPGTSPFQTSRTCPFAASLAKNEGNSAKIQISDVFRCSNFQLTGQVYPQHTNRISEFSKRNESEESWSYLPSSCLTDTAFFFSSLTEKKELITHKKVRKREKPASKWF